MKKLLLLLCLSLPAFGQIINPSDTTSGNASGAFSTLSASGLATFSGGAVIGPGYADDGTPTVAFAAKLSGANLIKAVTGDQYAHNIVLTTLRAAGNFSYTAVPGQQYAGRSQGTTTAGHWFGVSGTTAAAWVDLGAVGTSLGALSQPAYGVVIVGAADGANATLLWTGELTPIQTLLGAFTNPGDLPYCSAVTSGHCTAMSILAGNTSGTQFLKETSSGVPSWGTGAASSTLLDAQGTLGTVTPASGVDTTLFTTSITGGVIPSGKCVVVTALWKHTTNSVTSVFKFIYGSSAIITLPTSTSTQMNQAKVTMCNVSGSTPGASTQTAAAYSIIPGAATPVQPIIGTAAENSASTLALKLVVNVVSTTDVYTPEFWTVELLQ